MLPHSLFFAKDMIEGRRLHHNSGYHKMREVLDINPYDFVQDDSFFEEGMENVFLLLKQGEIIGTVALKGDEIDDLIVNGKYQGNGYGKQILHVAGWNEKAIALYKSIGFEITEKIEIK